MSMTCTVSAEICVFLVEQHALPHPSLSIHQQIFIISCWRAEKNKSQSWICSCSSIDKVCSVNLHIHTNQHPEQKKWIREKNLLRAFMCVRCQGNNCMDVFWTGAFLGSHSACTSHSEMSTECRQWGSRSRNTLWKIVSVWLTGVVLYVYVQLVSLCSLKASSGYVRGD